MVQPRPRFRFLLVSSLALMFTCLAVAQDSQQGTKPAPNDLPDHWSFKPIARPTPPAVKNSSWVRNPIDQFVLANLEKHGIVPSPEADRATLIRRLSLDLVGLPPAPAEVDQYLNDQRADAYEQLVGRLLSSPHFGERWGRQWLDLARYADSDGYEKDSPRPFAYLYRNWVIDALNSDLPFDRFTIEQLAGDLLPGEIGESADRALARRIATGFHRNTLTNKEGGVDQEEYRNKANVDRVSTTSTVWLALTLACCECHNHKYDPFTQREFYGVFSFFNTSQEVDLPAPQAAEVAAYEAARQAFDMDHEKLKAALTQFEREQLPARQLEWEKQMAGKPLGPRWVVLEPVHAASAGGATLIQYPDGSLQVAGKSPATDTYTIEVTTDLQAITAFRLEVLPDEKHPAKGPGRVKHGNFVLSEFAVTATARTSESAVQEARPVPLALQNASADFAQDKFPAEHAIDGNPATGWAVAPQLGQRHFAVFETKENLNSLQSSHSSSALSTHQSPFTLTFTLDQQFGAEHTIGKFRLSATAAPQPIRADDMPDEIGEILRVAAGERDQKQRAMLSAHYRTTDADWKKLNGAVVEHAKKAPPPPATRAMTIAQNATPPATHVHMRGDFLRKGDAVEPGTLAVLDACVPFKPRSDKPDRLDLARWIVDPANPLTSRVAVNRVWQHLFGRALVATPNDFGTRGELPSHPELLDWLAREFMDPSSHVTETGSHPWSQKELIKLIVESATYRQSSCARADLTERDPTNTLLARQNRFRLEAEVVRDLHLAASGLLGPAIGGPSVRPPQPAGISDLTYAGSAKWVESTGPDRYRRGMYTWFQRTSPYPMLTTFDSPDGVVCTVRRERSNTPLQALTLLNDAVFVECAQGLARRTLATALPREAKECARQMFRLCVSREPNASELARLLTLHEELTIACRANQELAGRLAGGLSVDAVDIVELAAWVAEARTIMNLDEFVTRE